MQYLLLQLKNEVRVRLLDSVPEKNRGLKYITETFGSPETLIFYSYDEAVDNLDAQYGYDTITLYAEKTWSELA